MLEFVKSAPHLHCVYGRRVNGRGPFWVGTIKPGVGGAPQFFPRTPMGWDAEFRATDQEAEEIEKFLLTLPPPGVK